MTPTGLHITAVLVYVIMAGLCQYDVIPVVLNLHQLVVKHLFRAGLTRNVVLMGL
jgi:hypothetical protein